MSIYASTYKALIFTTLFSSVVIFLTFTIHIKKKSEHIAETFYELDAETIEEEEKEELNDILKSLDNLLSTPSTNQAYNETKNYDTADDTKFNEQLEAIRNRNTIEDIKEATEENNVSTTVTKSKTEDSSAFSEINDILNKRSENQKAKLTNNNSANKNSSISYSLVDRTHTFLPTPVYLCEQGGKIVVNITVDKEGNVIDAYYNNASSSNNGCLIDHALEYAKAAKFNGGASKTSQLGSITFYFKGKH